MTVLAIILFAVAIVLAYLATSWSAAVAYAALILMNAGTHSHLGTWNIVFWAIASAIVIAAAWLQPAKSPARQVLTQGTAYVVTATMAGMLVGLLTTEAGMIIGAAVGAFLGALAFSRTPHGARVAFPSTEFVQYLAARGLSSIVTMCMLGLGITLLING